MAANLPPLKQLHLVRSLNTSVAPASVGDEAKVKARDAVERGRLGATAPHRDVVAVVNVPGVIVAQGRGDRRRLKL